VPIYEYLCQACAHRFEIKQKFSDPPVESCVRCGKSVSRLISAPAIMFKGSGWYVTDYSDKLKAPGEAAPNNGKGEATPEGKPPSKATPTGATGEAPAASAPAKDASLSPSSTTTSGSSGSSGSTGSGSAPASS
jgi:putative FmdB family regulatory protein